MIKFKGAVEDRDGGTRDVVFLGLTFENLTRLSEGDPVHVDTSQPTPEGVGLLGGPVVFIFAESDEAALLKKLKQLGAVDDDTELVLSGDLADPDEIEAGDTDAG